MSDDAEAEAAYLRMLHATSLSLRHLDLDAYADGIVAHRNGAEYHQNPHGGVLTVARLSWHLGWNERALRQR